MQKIYKRNRLESRFAFAFALSASLACTFTTVLVLLDAASYLPIALLVAISAGLVYGRFGRVYGIDIGVAEIMPALALNLAILAIFLVLVK